MNQQRISKKCIHRLLYRQAVGCSKVLLSIPVKGTSENEGGQATNSTSRWFRANLWIHRWASLVAAIPFLILCLSGTVLIFHEEIDAALGIVPVSTGSAVEKPLAESLDAVRAAYPDKRIISTGVDPKNHPGVQIIFVAPVTDSDFTNAKPVYTELATAKIVGAEDPGKTLTGFLLELHAEWFLGPVGRLIGALIGLLVFLSLVSGLVVYSPYVKRIAFGILRRGRGPRLLQLDLHNFIGAMMIGWALVVTATGCLLGLSQVALGVWQMTEFASIKAQYAQSAPVDARNPPVKVDAVLAAAQAAAPPGWQAASVIFPATDFSTPRHYAAFLTGAKGLDERLLKLMLVDAVSGEVSQTVELPAYLKAILISEPLHFGDYGNLPLKILWTLCTWLTLFITINGAWLWWDRRRRRQGKKIADEAHGDLA